MAFDYVATLEALNDETSKFNKGVTQLYTNKGFLAFRRFISGTALWPIINRFMGFINLYQLYTNSMKKGNKALIQQLKNWSKLKKEMKELDFGVTIAGYESILELVGKFDKSTGLFDGMNTGQSWMAKQLMWDDTLKTGKLEEMGYLMDMGYSKNEATDIMLETLKEIAEHQKEAKILAREEIALYKESNPIKRWWLKQKQRVGRFFRKDWGGFFTFLGKGITYLALIPILYLVLKKFFSKVSGAKKFFVDHFKELSKWLQLQVSQAGDAIEMIQTALRNEDFLGLGYALLKLAWNIGSILVGIFWMPLVIVLGTLVTAIIDSINHNFQAFKADGRVTAGEWAKFASQILSIILVIAAGIAFFASMGWVWVIGLALASALASAFGFSASGGMASGLTVVGERGPELVNLPGGSRVYSNNQSRRMNTGGNTFNINVTGRVGASDSEIRDIANKVAKEINTRINRTSASNTGF